MLSKKHLLPILVFLFILVLLPLTYLAAKKQQQLRGRAAMTKAPATMTPSSKDVKPKYVPGEVLVKFKIKPQIKLVGAKTLTNFPSINNLLEDFENPSINRVFVIDNDKSLKIKTIKEKFGLDKIYKISLSKDKLQSLKQKFLIPTDKQPFVPTEEIDELDITKLLVQKLKDDPSVEYAELNALYHTTDLFPNDTFFNLQWALHNTGETGGAIDADIDAPEAWQETTGEPQIIIAVLDTGVKYDHPDLQNNILRDANGNVIGYDFANSDSNPMDDNSHGTHVAGIIAAVSNNNLGVSGTCWSCKIMPLKFLSADGYGGANHAIAAMEFAMDNGANIINNSWGGGPYSQALQDTINAANEARILIIFSSGNDNIDMKNYYPASMDNVIAVGSSDKNDARSWFSNYGLTLDISAPGEEILSTFIPGYTLAISCLDDDGDGYGYCSGTSMATPYISGVAALILSQNPQMSLDELKRKLLFTGDDKGTTGWDKYFGFGRVNALTAITPLSIPRSIALIVDPLENKVISYRPIQIKGYAFADNFSSFKVEVGIGQSPNSWQTMGLTLANNGLREVFGDKLADFNTQGLPHGILTLKLTVIEKDGRVSESKRIINYMPERIIYVDDDNTSEIEDGTREHPFNTIQEGLDDANPLDTVKVLAGTYQGDIRVRKSEVALSGEYPWTTIVANDQTESSDSIGIRSDLYPDIHSDFLIENFTIEGFQRGILISGPARNGLIRNNIIKDIVIRNDGGYGIQLDHFDTDIKVVGNFIIGGRDGILQNGFANADNSFEFNYAINAAYGGITAVHFGENINFRENTAIDNQTIGMGVFGDFNNSVFYHNYLEKNYAGVLMSPSPENINNVVYENNFVNNRVSQVAVHPNVSNLLFSKNNKGNYWSTYDEADEGAFDNNGDGIADSPYQIDENNQDDFPIMNENGWFGTGLNLEPTKITTEPRFTILGENFGNFNERNRVILNYGRIHEQEASVSSWEDNRIEVAITGKIFPGRYYVDLIINGRNDNIPIFTGLVLTVFHTYQPIITPTPTPVCTPQSTIPGDLNCDCQVNIFDLVLIAGVYGSSQGDDIYKAEYDLNSDGTINLFDLVMVANKYGDSCQ